MHVHVHVTLVLALFYNIQQIYNVLLLITIEHYNTVIKTESLARCTYFLKITICSTVINLPTYMYMTCTVHVHAYYL